MEPWDEEGFTIVGSSVGNPLFMDRLNEERKRTRDARIFIEIDTKCKYLEIVIMVVDKLNIFGDRQSVKHAMYLAIQ